MKAICYTEHRSLEVREVPTPREPAPGHVIVNMDSASIMHGDKFFLRHPLPNGTWATARHDIYGSNGGGTIVAIGAGVPARYLDRKVAIYKALKPSVEATGLWCETAHVPFETCLILPDNLRVRDYNGSLANILTIYAFLAQAKSEGHRGVIVTAGSSATGLIAASFTRRRGIPAIFLVRSAAARERLVSLGIEHVLLTTEEDFEARLRDLATLLGATAVFDGVGGELFGRIVPALPEGATVYVAGIMGASTPAVFSTMHIVASNLTIKRFSVLETATLLHPEKLAAASRDIETLIDDPLLATRIGAEFRFEQIDEAMEYDSSAGLRPVLVAC
ncbi:MAG: zinc-binding dehydrogenase [Sphingomonadales bacterium]|nr:zinc-binding dehydrogenase [Sphingomonadales bacterium]MBK6493047.1 zinc-binding dehydrogenase [Sphingomonadales bacterium]MBK6720086.1 zinc-binding dehydrogenase [Sphingomonadales bacterium]MBK8861058.1 zinc-binding dehydrogenase [Sphingomonadales bacterium]MBK9587055.1 zinc-binding dehydrogenase [Sphingomonadales bacterium]